MKRLLSKCEQILKSKRGDIIQWVIVIIVIAIVATQAMPPLMNSITDKGTKSVNKLNTLETTLDGTTSED